MKSRSFSLFERGIKSPQTKEVYVYSLHEFMKFAKIQDYDDIVRLNIDEIQKLLEDWVLHLANKELKASTIKTKLNAIELFLEMNRVIFHKRILHKLIPSSDYEGGGNVPFTTEEIQKMMDATPKQYQIF